MSEEEQGKVLEDTDVRCFRRAGVAAEDLPSLARGRQAQVLLYTPQQCVFARLDGGKLLDHEGNDIAPETAFEIRIFHADWELRWRRQGQRGTAVLWATDAGDFDEEAPGKQPEKKNETQYLLWGKAVENSKNGWVRIGTHQVGIIHVPCEGAIAEGARLALRAIEYFAAFDDGNIAFIGERLAGITVAKTAKSSGALK